MADMPPRYNAGDITTDGPFTAPRYWHHILKALISLSLYVGFRDLGHLSAGLAALLSSPVLVVSIAIKEWSWPSDPNEHSYTKELRLEDFMTDLSCTLPVFVLYATAHDRWWLALMISGLGFSTYLLCRHNARP